MCGDVTMAEHVYLTIRYVNVYLACKFSWLPLQPITSAVFNLLLQYLQPISDHKKKVRGNCYCLVKQH